MESNKLFYYFLSIVLGGTIAGCNGHQETGQQKEQQELSASAPHPNVEETPTLTGNLLAGKKVYEDYCLTCHQSNGGGVPNLNPPLKGTAYVLGDKERLIGIVLKGSNEGLEINGETFDNAMPPHNFLSDEAIAQVLSYVRTSFGNQTDTIRVNEVKTVRAKLK
ncbi:hypothetical protein GCM10023231_40490 [Olivibacter ginsenosidimutans]|uniref:Cytochrome c domain-containing protein n=1 Tax=Olivibacter ginsenosidimutans TaxID=1176537 RepID=A0ABP9CFH0_9SPHI